LPDADKHRHCFIFASSLLAFVLVCLIATIEIHASIVLPVRKHADLERNLKLTKLAPHWTARRELCNSDPTSAPPLEASGNSDMVALWLYEAPNAFGRLQNACLPAQESTFLSYRLDRLAAPRAPPAGLTPFTGA